MIGLKQPKVIWKEPPKTQHNLYSHQRQISAWRWGLGDQVEKELDFPHLPKVLRFSIDINSLVTGGAALTDVFFGYEMDSEGCSDLKDSGWSVRFVLRRMMSFDFWSGLVLMWSFVVRCRRCFRRVILDDVEGGLFQVREAREWGRFQSTLIPIFIHTR